MDVNFKRITILLTVIFASIAVALVVFLIKISDSRNVTLPNEELYKNYDKELENYYYIVEDYYSISNGGYMDNREVACILLNDEREKWRFIPLTDKFLKRYANKKAINDNRVIKFSFVDGIDEIMLALDDEDDRKKVSDYARRLKCEKEDGIYAVFYELKLDKYKRIDDIKIIKEIKLYDNKTGYTDEYYVKFNKENFMYLFYRILFPEYIKENDQTPDILDRHNVALSKNFLNKYGYDKDVIENDADVPLSSFTLEDGDFEKRKFTCICGYYAKNLWKQYTVYFDLTNTGQLKDIRGEAAQ